MWLLHVATMYPMDPSNKRSSWLQRRDEVRCCSKPCSWSCGSRHGVNHRNWDSFSIHAYPWWWPFWEDWWSVQRCLGCNISKHSSLECSSWGMVGVAAKRLQLQKFQSLSGVSSCWSFWSFFLCRFFHISDHQVLVELGNSSTRCFQSGLQGQKMWVNWFRSWFESLLQWHIRWTSQ